jgi:hypothetical protein
VPTAVSFEQTSATHATQVILEPAPSTTASEEKKNTIAVGINVTNDSANNQQANLSAYFRKYVFGANAGDVGAVYAQTFYDVTGVTLKPLNISNAQYSAKQSASVIIMKPAHWVTIFAFVDVGILGTKDVSTTFTYGLGGYPEFNIKNKFFIDIMPRFSAGSVTGNAVETRFYGGIKF